LAEQENEAIVLVL